MSDQIDLQPAYCWDCPDCGVTNFIAADSESDVEREQSIRDALKLGANEPLPPDVDDIRIHALPELLKCGKCGRVDQLMIRPDGEIGSDRDRCRDREAGVGSAREQRRGMGEWPDEWFDFPN